MRHAVFTDEIKKELLFMSFNEIFKSSFLENITSVSASHKITLKWDEVNGADRYAVYIYNAESKKYTLYQYVTSEKCTVTSLRSNTKYKFIIQSMKKASDGKYVSSEEAEYSASTLSA